MCWFGATVKVGKYVGEYRGEEVLYMYAHAVVRYKSKLYAYRQKTPEILKSFDIFHYVGIDYRQVEIDFLSGTVQYIPDSSKLPPLKCRVYMGMGIVHLVKVQTIYLVKVQTMYSRPRTPYPCNAASTSMRECLIEMATQK
jgi:hypothetical protein